ncbi:tumor necrosis factor alpha-induced protein 8-like protein 3 [Phyllostomus hastatus]|uniref:tumor necrosis factor alpha-induced protein 8-like protein 3 n=1 Tax=Phyllostomus hastatus TaxID=9423 RepID=UPI001E6813D9|nr:tumor necrosis factor alpha-induced protein 8-like protein 3 [Phyllostomus hastatus]
MSLMDSVTIQSLLGNAGGMKLRLLTKANWEMNLLSVQGPLVDHECPAESSKLGHYPQEQEYDFVELRTFRAQGAGRARVGGVAPPPGYLTPVWGPRGAGRPGSSLIAPPLSPPCSLPARPTLCPALSSSAGTGRRAPGAGHQRRSSRTAHTAPPRLTALSAPDSPSRDAGPKRPADGRAAVNARPAAHSMDSDSGEQSEGEPVTTAGPDVFCSKSLAIQAQKKILSKIASKTVASMLIDDTSSEIFDELYKVTKEHTRNKKEAHKIMKDLIKVAIKIGILYRNNQFNQEEVAIVEKFRKKLNQTAMTIISFYEVEYTFEKNVLSKLLHECKDLVHELVQRHLTPRTHGRINHVFNHFADVEFLSTLYSLDGNCRPNLKRICEGIHKLLDENVL